MRSDYQGGGQHLWVSGFDKFLSKKGGRAEKREDGEVIVGSKHDLGF